MVGEAVKRADGDVFAASFDGRKVSAVYAHRFGDVGLGVATVDAGGANSHAQLVKACIDRRHSVDYNPHKCRLKQTFLGLEEALMAGAKTSVVVTHPDRGDVGRVVDTARPAWTPNELTVQAPAAGMVKVCWSDSADRTQLYWEYSAELREASTVHSARWLANTRR